MHYLVLVRETRALETDVRALVQHWQTGVDEGRIRRRHREQRKRLHLHFC